MGLDKHLMEILVCPACKSALREEGQSLICQNASCHLEYPVMDGIPVMLISEAQKRT